MGDDFKLDSLLNRLQIWGNKGLVNKSTARNLRMAVDRLSAVVDEELKHDVRKINSDDVINRFSNLNPEVSPASLRTYKSRLEKSIQMFVDYHNDKLNWRPDLGRKVKKTNQKRNASNAEDKRPGNTRRETPQDTGKREMAHEETLNIPFPLRKETTITIGGIPRDLTTAECERLSAFLKALAVDFGTSSQN